MKQPMIVYDPNERHIEAVLCRVKQLAVGDVLYQAAVGRSYHIPAYCYTIERIECPERETGKQPRITLHIRRDDGYTETLDWPLWSVTLVLVVRGDKIVRANTEAGAVKKTLAGWIWQEGRD